MITTFNGEKTKVAAAVAGSTLNPDLIKFISNRIDAVSTNGVAVRVNDRDAAGLSLEIAPIALVL
jgi:hypothetical protein